MSINKVGKFEIRRIVDDFDNALISLYGINMTDAGISRFEALSSIEETGCARRAAELFGQKRGLAQIGS